MHDFSRFGVTPASLQCSVLSLRDMSFKFGISAVKGPTEVLAMSRICVEPDSTALHVAAVCLDCTSCQAREKISRLEAFTSYGCDGKTQLGLADLEGGWIQGPQVLPALILKEDGFKDAKTTTTAKYKNL